MADRIKGITIELDGDTSGLSDALKKVTDRLKDTQASLKDVNKLLKLDPGNTELLEQKQTLLSRAVKDVEEKLKMEREALKQLEAGEQTEETIKQQENLRREIVDNELQLKNYKKQLDETDQALEGTADTTEDTTKATDDLGKEMDDTGGKSKTFGDMLKANLTAEAIKAGITAVIGLVKELASAIGEVITGTSKWADDLSTLSKQTGISTETLQEYQYMADFVDTSVETVTGSLTKLTRNMQSASKGTGTAYEAFEALGVSITDANGELRDNEEVFKDVLDALGQVENETERDALAMNIFGKSAQQLNPLILAGGETLDQLAQEAHNVGYVLDQETVDSLAEVDDAFVRLRLTGQSLTNQLGATLAPTITTLTDTLTSALADIDMDGITEQIGGIIEELGQIIIDLAPTLIDLLNTLLQVLTPLLELLSPILQLLTELLKPIIQLIQVLLPPIIALIKQVFEGLMRELYPIVQAVTSFISDKVVPAVQKVIEWVQNVWDKVHEIIPKVKEEITTKIGEAVEWLKKLPEEALQWGKDLLQSFINGITEKIQALRDKISEIASTVKSYIHFSEPDVGPLSDFNTYAPDMMKTFIEGIQSNIPTLRKAMEDMAKTVSNGMEINPTANVSTTLSANNTQMVAELNTLANVFTAGIKQLTNMGIYLDGKQLVGYVNRNMGSVYGG